MSLQPTSAANPSLNHDHATVGVLNALGCFGVWGLFPIYFKLLSYVPPLEVLAHRIVWSAVVLSVLILAQGRWSALLAEFRDQRRLRFYLSTTLLISLI